MYYSDIIKTNKTFKKSIIADGVNIPISDSLLPTIVSLLGFYSIVSYFQPESFPVNSEETGRF
jgi:hypothetical protein